MASDDDDDDMIKLSHTFRVVAADKKIGGWSRPVLWWCSGVAGGALPVHTDALYPAVFCAVYYAYSFSFAKS